MFPWPVSGIAFPRFTPNMVVGSRIPPLFSALRFQALVLTLVLICLSYNHIFDVLLDKAASKSAPRIRGLSLNGADCCALHICSVHTRTPVSCNSPQRGLRICGMASTCPFSHILSVLATMRRSLPISRRREPLKFPEQLALIIANCQ